MGGYGLFLGHVRAKPAQLFFFGGGAIGRLKRFAGAEDDLPQQSLASPIPHVSPCAPCAPNTEELAQVGGPAMLTTPDTDLPTFRFSAGQHSLNLINLNHTMTILSELVLLAAKNHCPPPPGGW